MTTGWPTYIVTTLFVAHPDHLGRAQRLYVERLHRIPTQRVRIHFVSSSPTPEESEFFLWDLRCTSLYDGLRCEIPEPESLELYSVHCVISYDPDFEDEVHEKLFFADHTAPDPFPGFLSSVEIERFVPGREWVPVASRWLVTLHLMAAEDETEALETEYSRLLAAVRETEGLELLSFSPTLVRTDDVSVAGPLWLKDARRAVADISTPSVFPRARRLHRARLVLTCSGDPTGLLPEPELPGSWTAEPLV